MKVRYILLAIVFVCSSLSCKKDPPTAVVNMHGAGLNLAGVAFATVNYNGNLIVAGKFDSAGNIPVNNIVQWDGKNWTALGSGISNTVYALAVYNGNLIAAGNFDTAGGNSAVNNIAQWNGTTWTPLGAGVTNYYHIIYALSVYNSNLIAGGNFEYAGGNLTNNIAMWNGTIWSSIGSGISGTGAVNNIIRTMSVYNGNLIAGGAFNTSSGAPGNAIAEWNGTAWLNIGNGLNDYDGITALTVYNGNLIAAGGFDSIGGVAVQNIASWNGSSWASTGGRMVNPTSLFVFNGTLYAGTNNGSYNGSIYSWNGTTWSFSDSPEFSIYQMHISGGYFPSYINEGLLGVSAISAFNGQLIATGCFNVIFWNNLGTTGYAQSIAQWDGSTWQAL